MFCGHITKKKNIKGFVTSNCVQPKQIKMRHDLLVEEMIKRGMNHKSPIELNPDISYLSVDIQEAKVDILKSTIDLISRCLKCKEKAKQFIKGKRNG